MKMSAMQYEQKRLVLELILMGMCLRTYATSYWSETLMGACTEIRPAEMGVINDNFI